MKEQRKARLLDFHRAELDAACRMPFTRARPAVASRRGTAARPGVKEMPDEWTRCAWVDSLNGDTKASAPASHRPVRARRCECADDRFNDLLPTMTCAERHRCAGIWP